MKWAGSRAYGALVWLCFGCSFAGERLPRTPTAEQHATHAEGRCPGNSVVYPIVDSISTLSAASWVVYFNQKLKESAAPEGAISQDQSNDSTYRTLRTASYIAIPLYAAAAIWGFYVESKCPSERPERAVNEPVPTPKRAGFPGSVFGFDYRMRPEQAAALCASKGQEWVMEDSTGLCQSRVASVVVPDLRLQFRLGAASEITVIYRSAATSINQNYAELYAATKKNYGPPQVEPTRISALCARSLAECLANGEHPSGPIWQWADGSIELTPVWQEDHALLELHYTHEESPAQ